MPSSTDSIISGSMSVDFSHYGLSFPSLLVWYFCSDTRDHEFYFDGCWIFFVFLQIFLSSVLKFFGSSLLPLSCVRWGQRGSWCGDCFLPLGRNSPESSTWEPLNSQGVLLLCEPLERFSFILLGVSLLLSLVHR